eukprot:scaffold188648_cov18-Tisochrysis_lutea.AAC.2
MSDRKEKYKPATIPNKAVTYFAAEKRNERCRSIENSMGTPQVIASYLPSTIALARRCLLLCERCMRWTLWCTVKRTKRATGCPLRQEKDYLGSGALSFICSVQAWAASPLQHRLSQEEDKDYRGSEAL